MANAINLSTILEFIENPPNAASGALDSPLHRYHYLVYTTLKEKQLILDSEEEEADFGTQIKVLSLLIESAKYVTGGMLWSRRFVSCSNSLLC